MRKLIIGITGTFGSGKSTVAKILRKHALVVDADRLAKRLAGGRKIRSMIKKQFKTADRRRLADIVFSDRKKLARLNRIIHPEVRKEIRNIAKKSRKHVIIDAPLLVEAGFLDELDFLLVIACDPQKRASRLVKKGFSEEEINARTRFQLSEEEKMKHADCIIDNSGSLASTKKQVEKIWKRITKLT